MSGVSCSKLLEMEAYVLLALATAAWTWMVNLREESIVIARSLTELTSGMGMGVPLSPVIRLGLGGNPPMWRFWHDQHRWNDSVRELARSKCRRSMPYRSRSVWDNSSLNDGQIRIKTPHAFYTTELQFRFIVKDPSLYAQKSLQERNFTIEVDESFGSSVGSRGDMGYLITIGLLLEAFNASWFFTDQALEYRQAVCVNLSLDLDS